MRSFLSVAILDALVCLLAACGTAGTMQPAASPLSPTPTAVVPTVTASFQSVSDLSDLHMIDFQNGWAWSAAAENRYTLLHTLDGGRTWRDVTPKGLPFVPDGSFILDGQTAWLQIYNPTPSTVGLIRTTDGGQTWSLVSNDLQFASASVQIQFSTPQDGWAEAVVVGTVSNQIQLYQSRDGGSHWSTVMVTSPATEPFAANGGLQLCNPCGDRLYVDPLRLILTHGDLAANPGGGLRLDLSTDLGRSWTGIQLDLPARSYDSDWIVPAPLTFFDDHQGLLPVQMQDPSASGPDTASLVLYLTSDGGRTWRSGSTVLKGVNLFDTVDAVSPLDVFIACGGDLCATHDGGQTWVVLHSGLSFVAADTGEPVTQFDFVNPSTGWALAGKAGSSSLYETQDGGASWTKLPALLLP